jgi:hypothetical protein
MKQMENATIGSEFVNSESATESPKQTKTLTESQKAELRRVLAFDRLLPKYKIVEEMLWDQCVNTGAQDTKIVELWLSAAQQLRTALGQAAKSECLAEQILSVEVEE